jgi:hypothetical protein
MTSFALLNAYIEVLHRWDGRIASEDCLPAPKQDIKNAIIAVARAEKAAGNVPSETMEQFRIAYAFLADFVSREEAEIMGDYHNLLHGTAKDLSPAELAQVITNSRAWGLGSEIQCRNTDEFRRLVDEFNAAMNSRGIL